MAKILLALADSLIPAIVAAVSPELKAELKSALDKLEAKAKTTTNPFDDIAVKLLRGILGY